ncbi:MAG: hypothetical protein JWN43_297 [Gammaproteobacteria bacterium]|nr:hypothetical protein [Gammaproteobacteria bacterium]
MNTDYTIHDEPEHEEISVLLPWYVNGTLAEFDRQRVDLHLRNCEACREDLQRERYVYGQMATDIGVEYMPGPSLKRLQAKLDDLGAPTLADAAAPAERSGRRTLRWQGALAASVAAMAVVLGLSALSRWMPMSTPAFQPNYYTVTTAAARPPDEVIRAVFSPTITLVELQEILDESQLRIISGPTEAGVYSLAATSARPVDSSLAMLRQHPTVRFAESTQPLTGAGAVR